MCKKCTKHHHTLLHKGTYYLSPRKPEIKKGNDETHVSALSVSEQVHLMSCKVKVTAPNGSSMIARVLIDPMSSSSFVHGRLAEDLRLPRSNKNVKVEGIGETSMATRGSIWLQVSGVEEDGEKIGVAVFVLKK